MLKIKSHNIQDFKKALYGYDSDMSLEGWQSYAQIKYFLDFYLQYNRRNLS